MQYRRKASFWNNFLVHIFCFSLVSHGVLAEPRRDTRRSARRRAPAPPPPPPVTNKFWAAHILNEYFTGPANKDLGNLECDVGFVAFYCFGQQKAFSDYNSEEHVDNTVFENVYVNIKSWGTGAGQYLSCCPPGSKTNAGNYYRCNTWTTEKNDNCHTPGLPWNDGKIKKAGGQVPAGSQPVGGHKQWMWSFPAEGEGSEWTQGLARRVHMHELGMAWAKAAGGCNQCQGKDLEDPCYGKCITGALDTVKLISLTNNALQDTTNFPNFGIPNCEGILFAKDTSKCIDLSGANSAYGTGIDLWDCNGLVNQAWYWPSDGVNIELGGHNLPGMCIDLPGGNAQNGNQLWLWGCNGGASQQWVWDQATSSIRYKANTNFCVDLPGGDTTNGNSLWLWQCNGGDTQKWAIYSRGTLSHGIDKQRANNNNRKRPKVHRSWMHEVKNFLRTTDWNNSMPADFVPWYETKAIKDWHAAQMPGPNLPRPMVPKGWKGYNVSYLQV